MDATVTERLQSVVTCSGISCITVCVGEEPPCTIKDYGPGSGGLRSCVVEGKKCASGDFLESWAV